MFTKFNLYIGLNDKDSKVQEISTIDAYKIIGAICGDCTITEGKGLYTHQDGTLDIVPVINSIKAALNQESVAVIREQVDSRLL